MSKLDSIIFERPYDKWSPGERAGFPPHTAQKLVDRGYARRPEGWGGVPVVTPETVPTGPVTTLREAVEAKDEEAIRAALLRAGIRPPSGKRALAKVAQETLAAQAVEDEPATEGEQSAKGEGAGDEKKEG